ncbi:UNVERIFIED_ORG: 4-hydroxy-2-oxoheptanedioate aldolase [Paraburkholderia sediminicola]|nr:4-hydroxy-2-oxoheptanedioate aldolase [Paraburkholderia sediminicola]
MEKLDFGVTDVRRRVRRLANVPWLSDTPNQRIFNAHELIRRNYQIDKREPLLALFSIIPTLELVEIAAGSEFDGTILDTEHGSYRTETLPALILAARAHRIFPIARVRCNDASLIDVVLDAGAAGVLAPQIRSIQETTQAVRAARFAPEGAYGANPWVRAGGYGCSPRWFETTNNEAAALPMIEGSEGWKYLPASWASPTPRVRPAYPMHWEYPSKSIMRQCMPQLSKRLPVHLMRASRRGPLTHGNGAKTWLDCGARFVATDVDRAHISFTLTNFAQDLRSAAQASRRTRN